MATIPTLATILREHPGEPLVLLVRSRPVGDQLLARLAQEGLSWANVRVATPLDLALDLAVPFLAARGLVPASGAQTLFLVDRLLRAGLGGAWLLGNGSPNRPAPSDGLVAAVHRSLMELRQHGLEAASLDPHAFTPPAKGEALRELLAAYEATLDSLGLVDRAGLLRLAIERLREQPPERTGTRYLVPVETLFQGLEQVLVQHLTQGRLIPFQPGWGPPQRIHFFHATSPEAELREVLRRAMAQGLPWDRVEVVATDLATYGPILHALAARLGIPVTFSEGLPLAESGPGRGALAYLEWVARGFPAAVLAGALAGGDLVPPRREGGGEGGKGEGGEGGAGAARGWGRRLAQTLLESPIGWGWARYRAWVEQTLAASADGRRDPAAEARVALARFLQELLRLTPDPERSDGVPLPQLVTALRQVVHRFTVTTTPLDRGGWDALLQTLAALEGLAGRVASAAGLPLAPAALVEAAGAWLEAPEGEPLPRLALRLRRWLAEVPVGQGEPQPGALHLASLEHGGYAGRPYLFVVGLDEGRFPGKGGADPLLLDGDRARLPGELPSSASRQQWRRRSLEALVARAGGTLTCSFAAWDPVEGQEVAPSPALLDLFRQATGAPQADYTALREALGAPAGRVPAPGGALPLDGGEAWLDALRVGPPGGERLARPEGEGLQQAFPFLAAGQRAREARASPVLTAYDGLVTPAGSLDPRTGGEAVSAGRLESLATCPLQYFFRYVLKVAPPERPELDPDRWLDPLARGALLHECYRRFWEERLQAGRAADPLGPEDWARMEAIAQEAVARQREALPPPSEGVFERERQELVAEALFFLELEARRDDGGVPVLLERAFGMQGEPPVVIELGGEGGAAQRLRLLGRIDRVDRLPDGTYGVWDYKTGSARRYESERIYLDGGRQLQHVLYSWAAEALLRREGLDETPRVARSGYWLTTRRGRGHRADRPQDPGKRREAQELLQILLDVAASGCFAPAPDAQDGCDFCDYRRACGGPAAVRQVREKIEAGETRLRFWREVRAHD